MDEIEYKLNTNNSVLVVNAVDKLITLIKSQYKPAERQRFALENEQLKILRSKCSAKEQVVSLTACQGLLALVELGVLEIGHTMSTIVTLLPSAHNYSAIISTMAGLLILDLKSRLILGQPYQCQFSLKSPQHPFITVLEKNKAAEDDVLTQMHALCTHPDYVVSSNSLELLRPVFLWLTCNPRYSGGARPWQLLLSLPPSEPQLTLLLSCLSCQQICSPEQVSRAAEAYSAVADTAVHGRDAARVAALLPALARVSNELLRHGRDPRSCYNLMERCVALDAAELRAAAGLTLALLADNLPLTTALYLHELLNLCLNITTKFKCSSVNLNTLVAFSLQWLHMPSYLTTNALKVAAKLLDIYQTEEPENQRLDMPNLKTNKIFETLLYTDRRLSVVFKLNETWEKVRDDPERFGRWLEAVERADDAVKLELVGFLIGIAMERRKEEWYEEIALRALKVAVSTVEIKKELSVLLLPVLAHSLARGPPPRMRLECLRALPLMAKTKENVHNVVSILNKLKAGKGVPTALLIVLFTSLAETQVRCFPYLQELLAEAAPARLELRWELDVARAAAARRVCRVRPSSHGLELVSTISSILNRCSDKSGAVATGLSLQALGWLWRGAAVAPSSTWRALEPRLGGDSRPAVQLSICQLLGEVPGLRVQSAEYDKLTEDAARRLWTLVSDSNHAPVAIQACRALANYRIGDYKLKDIPQVYRNSVKLPPSFCKTPADAARKPEDVLDYVPCEVWPEVFKFTNQDALEGVEYLATKLIEREIRGYRSGVYQQDARVPPQNMGYLPATSVLRGLMDCFKRQVTSPSYDFPDAVLLSMLRALCAEYPRPLPPLELWFLQELSQRGRQWTHGCLQLAAGQAAASPPARALLDNYLLAVDPETSEESDIMLMFELLPLLCRGMPPNSLRGPLEKCLSSSLDECLRKRGLGPDALFVRQLDMVRACLESERIHDANRTLLSQIVEGYFAVIPEDNIAWPTYVQTCVALSSSCLERMTSPSGWWEVTGPALRKACRVRCALAAAPGCRRPLACLSELIDQLASHPPEQQYSLQCILEPLQAVNPDDQDTREWFLQLMARTQVAFKETEDVSAHLYLCDVFMLSVVVLSGHAALLPAAAQLPCSRAVLQEQLPAAAAALLARPPWQEHTLQMLEWVSHSRSALGSRGAGGAAAACQRTLVALRHTPQFATHKIWMRLENRFGKIANNDD